MHDKNADADIINEKMQYAHEETFSFFVVTYVLVNIINVIVV